MADKFCKDCKHSRVNGHGTPDLTCSAAQNYVEHVDRAAYLVSGIMPPATRAMRGANCHTLRLPRPPEVEAVVCGPSGKWFEPKESAA